jgi:cobaltochelatase CobS
MSNLATTTQTTQAAPVDFYALEEVCASKIFPDFYNPGDLKLKRRIHRSPECIPSNPDFIPDEKMLRRTLAWFFAPRCKPLGLVGETGTGKTEHLLYIADRLNEPCYITKVHPALMPEDLEGSKELVSTPNGVVTRNALGLAAKAYKHGGLLILDEIDKANAALGCALHGLTDAKPWPIEQFGIILNMHSFCRVAATANTMGEGSNERYHTSNRMDAALRSRFGWLKTNFPDKAREMKILTNKFPKLPPAMLKECVRVANAFRDALLGPQRDGKIDNPINAVFSTRTLVHWCHYTMVFGLKATWGESLDFAFQGSLDPDYHEDAKQIVQRILGDLINKNVDEVVRHFAPAQGPK